MRAPRKVGLVSLRVDGLRVQGLAACRAAGLAVVDELVDRLRRDRVTFLLPARGALPWDRVAFLNLAFWTVGGGELLGSRHVPVDQLTHLAWHHVVRQTVGAGVDAMLLGEAIASSFDAYLIGALLRSGSPSTYLDETVPRLWQRANDAGMRRTAFERMLRAWAEDPSRSMESLRSLLYDASRKLYRLHDVRKAATALRAFDAHPLAPLLHHYELSNWILAARATSPGSSRRAAALDRRLRRSADPMSVLRSEV